MKAEPFDIFRLTFQTPLHLSKGKLNTYESSEQVLHSDTLKSAIFAAAIQLFGDQPIVEDWFSHFRVSSAMPFLHAPENGTIEYFFPKPLVHPEIQFPDDVPVQEHARLYKKAKKISWLGKSLFEKTLAGNPLRLQGAHLLMKDVFVSEAFEGLAKEKRDKLIVFERQQTQRVKIPRLSEEDADSVPFYLDKLYFHPKAGLYFFITTDRTGESKEPFLQKLHGALRLLGNNGIGLQRGLGNGQFRAKRDQLTLQLPEQPSAYVNISLYCPTLADIQETDLDNSAYYFFKRGGWISSSDEAYISYRKKSIYMLGEGSVLRFPGTENWVQRGQGQIDLTPQQTPQPLPSNIKIWRDGTGIFLPIKVQP